MIPFSASKRAGGVARRGWTGDGDDWRAGRRIKLKLVAELFNCRFDDGVDEAGWAVRGSYNLYELPPFALSPPARRRELECAWPGRFTNSAPRKCAYY